MFQGINFVSDELASKITRAAFKNGLIIETSGADDQVIKLLCPLVIKKENLIKGLDIIEESIREVCSKENSFQEEEIYFQRKKSL